jgi:thiol:disulfide interchange protein/DsbC/DsbD-like thiol-disulfide interchange protein
MKSKFRLSALALILGSVFAPLSQGAAPSHVTADLVSEHRSIKPGGAFTVALRLRHKEHWHTYWKNPGTGIPTSVEWKLPPGYTHGPIQWPVPKVLDSLGIVTYGYEGEVFLPVEIDAPSDLRPGSTARLTGRANWLMCSEICIPAGASLELTLPVRDSEPEIDERWKQGFAAARAKLPRVSAQWNARVHLDGDEFVMSIVPIDGAAAIPENIYFFPADGQVDAVPRQPVERVPGGVLLRLPKAPFDSHLDTDPEVLEGILYAETGWLPDGSAPALRISAKVEEKPTAAVSAADLPGGTKYSFLAILTLAFAGGLILNLMPCVFPVLGLKIVGFVDRAGDDPRRVALHGVVFAVGIVISFWILAGILVALRSGGEELGWGFQLQSPAFVFTLAVIITAFALNLSGLFEFGLAATGFGGRLSGKKGYGGSLLSGVLATVLATPCAAPFLAPALGAALTLTPAGSFLVFTTIGTGLAAPYLALSLFPGCVQRLPDPGPWMETFKHVMAFPLFATSGFLLWVLAGQVSEDQFLSILFSLVLIGFGLWVYGRWTAPANSARARIVSRISAALILAGGMLLGFPGTPADSLTWEPWSPERVSELRAEGRPVYIDFTARWCATCKANKKLVFSSREVLETFRSKRIATLKADWTNEDPRITAALASFNRSAVPLNIYHAPGAVEPRILPELLTPGIVLEIINSR